MIYLEFYIVLKKKKKRMIFLSKERQRWVRLTILSKRGNMRRMKMLFWLFFPRARGASIGIFSPSGIYHQKIRIIIILVVVCSSWFMIWRHKWGRLRRRCKTNYSKLCLNSQLGEAILEEKNGLKKQTLSTNHPEMESRHHNIWILCLNLITIY